MSIRHLVLDGSVTEVATLKSLLSAKAFLESMKCHKLWSRHEKNKALGVSNFQEVYSHLVSEAKELQEGLDLEDLDNVLEELADMSNCIDILAMLVYREKGGR